MNIASVPSEIRKAKFEQWMREHETAVLRTCYLYLGDRTLAEDALQDTFIKVWRSMDTFERRNECTAKTWIMRIAINTCKNFKLSAWLRHVDKSKSAEEVLVAQPGIEPVSRELYLDVLRLPDKYKQVILLYYYQDMSMEETAHSLGISRPTLIRRLKKAYTLLHHTPEGRGFDEEGY